MPYPRENPTAKHDFLIHSEDELPKSASAVFEQLDSPIEPSQLKKNSTIYSYPDGPRHPGPISRSLTVIGLIEASSDVVQRLCNPNSNYMHRCTIGVKMFNPNLPEKDKTNSMNFAKFVTRLRREEAVAILSKDKYGRFGILKPMAEENGTGEKFAAECFVGDIENAKRLFPETKKKNNRATISDDGWGAGDDGTSETGLWQPPGAENGDTDMAEGGASAESLWKPPGSEEKNETFNLSNDPIENTAGTWQPEVRIGKKRHADEMENGVDNGFHKDIGAATADKFYSGLTRTLDTRSESRLYHMRAFNGWVKATQIQELNPQTMQGGKRKKGSTPMRVLDLACGKGGDLGKWILHPRRMSNYVGVDVARGSLKDAAVRARGLRNKLDRCTFMCADLGADVPGRLRSPKKTKMQKLLSWSLQNESEFESGTPQFELVRGGGVSQSDKFDVVSIQFAIHYMMSTRKRARRFFRTVSELLEIGGNLIATTIDARVVVNHLMGLGEDLHFDSKNEGEEDPDREMVVAVGADACRIRFRHKIVKRIFKAPSSGGAKLGDDLFGLEYTFTLREGSDHAAGVGEAVDLPEWLTPLPALKSLADEAGLELEYAQNFHEFFETRKDPQAFPAAHLALYNMKVLNKNGSISSDEWEISRLYCAVKFRKVREAESALDDDSEAESDDDAGSDGNALDSKQEKKEAASERADPKFLVKAMLDAKLAYGKDNWDSLSGEEKKRLTQIELEKLANK